ncbi:hypothetical protein D3C81_2039020 [compost metagenome]
MPVMTFAQKHAGEKRAQGGGETQQVSQPGRQQNNHQRQQYEQFGRAGGGDFMEQSG